jgi:geranylgeranyl diphosphate synthase type II
MDFLDDLRVCFNTYLEANRFTQSPSELYEPNNYFLSLGGKRLRPLMVLLGTKLYGEDIQRALPAALAIEYFHNFSLIHDDVMDQAPLRRGKATVHEKFGVNTAILSGDALLVYAYHAIAGVPEKHLKMVLDIFNKTAIEVCEGQQEDMNFQSRTDVSEAEYLEMIRKKTSVVLAAALQIGALIGGASEEDASSLYQYALHLGIAFQIQDDILDCYGDVQLVGKQTGGDILQNKKTLLLIRALELTEKQADPKLREALEKHSPHKVANVLKIFDDYQILESVTETRNGLIDKALQHLEATTLPETRKEWLRKLVDYLVIRNF